MTKRGKRKRLLETISSSEVRKRLRVLRSGSMRKLPKKRRYTVASLRRALQAMTVKATANATEAGQLLAKLAKAHSQLASLRSKIQALHKEARKIK